MSKQISLFVVMLILLFSQPIVNVNNNMHIKTYDKMGDGLITSTALVDYENREISMERWSFQNKKIEPSIKLPEPIFTIKFGEYEPITMSYSSAADTVSGYYGLALKGYYRYTGFNPYLLDSDFTLVLVFKIDEYTGSPRIILSVERWGDITTGSMNSITLIVGTYEHLYINWEYGNGVNSGDKDLGVAIETGKWYILIIRNSESSSTLWVTLYDENGYIQDGTVDYTGIPWYEPDGDPTLMLGNKIDSDGTDNIDTTLGEWDILYIFDKILTDEEIELITNTIFCYQSGDEYFRGDGEYWISGSKYGDLYFDSSYLRYTARGDIAGFEESLNLKNWTLVYIRDTARLYQNKSISDGVASAWWKTYFWIETTPIWIQSLMENKSGTWYDTYLRFLEIYDGYPAHYLNFTYSPYWIVQYIVYLERKVVVRLVNQFYWWEIEYPFGVGSRMSWEDFVQNQHLKLYLPYAESVIIVNGIVNESVITWVEDPNSVLYRDPVNTSIVDWDKMPVRNLYLLNQLNNYAYINVTGLYGSIITVVAPHSQKILSLAVQPLWIDGQFIVLNRDYTVYLVQPIAKVRISLYNIYTGMGVPEEMFKVYVNKTRISSPLEYNAPIGSSVEIEVYDFWNRLLFNKTYQVNNSAEYLDIPLELGSLYIYNEMDTDLKVNVSCLNATSEIILSFVIFRRTGISIQLPAGVYNISFAYGNETIRVRSMLVQVTIKGEQLEVSPSKIIIKERMFNEEPEIAGIPISQIRFWAANAIFVSLIGIIIRELYVEWKKKQLEKEMRRKKSVEIIYM